MHFAGKSTNFAAKNGYFWSIFGHFCSTNTNFAGKGGFVGATAGAASLE
jgi:hypothetical protein